MASARYTIGKGGQRKVQSYFDQSCGSIRPQLYSFGTPFYPSPCFGHIPARCTLFRPPPYFFPCPLWSSLAIRTILWRFLSFFFLHFFVCFLLVLCLSFFLTAVVSGLPECVCCVCRNQYEDMTWHCLPLLPHSHVVSLCRSFVTIELVSL